MVIKPKSSLEQMAESEKVDKVENKEVPQTDSLMANLSKNNTVLKKKLSNAKMESDSDSDDSAEDMKNRSCDEVDSDDLEGDLNLSDDGNEDRARDYRGARRMVKGTYNRAAARVYR